MQPSNCLNCGAVLLSHQKYCYNCGQKAETRRITLPHLAQDFLYAIIKVDKGLLHLIKGLAIHPGKVAAEYIQGRRKSYFNPFAFMALCIAFMVFMHKWIKPYADPPEPDPKVMARIPDERMKELYVLTVKRTAGIQNFGNKNLNIISVLVAPYFAFFLWLFFRKRGRNIAEITLAYILFTGFGLVLSTVLISPWLASLRDTPTYYPVFYGNLLLQTMYYAWGLKTFFNYTSVGGYIKVLSILLLIGIVGYIVLIICLFIYVYHGEAFNVLKYLGS